MDHFAEQTNLYESRQQREEQAGSKRQVDQCLAPDQAINRIDHFLHAGSSKIVPGGFTGW